MVLRVVTLILSCIAAPMIAAALGALVYTAGDEDIETYVRSGWLGVALIGGMMGFLYGVPAMVLVGLPLHVFFQKRGMTGLLTYAVGGGFAGLLTALAFVAPNWRWPMSEPTLKLMLVGIGTGVTAASLFLVFWRMRKPIRDTTENAA